MMEITQKTAKHRELHREKRTGWLRAATLGGASITKGALRVAFWGTVAMGCTAIIGHLFGTVL